MCQNANKTAYALLKAVEPSLTGLLAFLGQTNTTAGIAVVTAYNSALTALQNWQQGTTAENVIELIDDFLTGFNALAQSIPVLPPGTVALINVIVAGIEAVIGIINANSPAPPAPAGAVAVEEPQALHQAAVAADTAQKVHALVPGIKLSRFHSPQHQYQSAWNGAVDSNGLPTSLKI